MRITEIKFEGRNQTSAVLRRAPGAAVIEAAFTSPAGTRTRTARADDKEDLWDLASCLQIVLDGHRGCGGDVRGYMLPLELMSDL